MSDLESIYEALVQAQDCIRDDTPEDMTRAEAIEDTISKVRDAMRAIEAMQAGGVAQAPSNDPYARLRRGETVTWDKDGAGTPAQAAWQPIETVPENHFTVLVYGKYGRLTAFRDVAWQWWPFPAGEPLDYTPTHWMPLPEAPVVSSTHCEGGK